MILFRVMSARTVQSFAVDVEKSLSLHQAPFPNLWFLQEKGSEICVFESQKVINVCIKALSHFPIDLNGKALEAVYLKCKHGGRKPSRCWMGTRNTVADHNEGIEL